MSFSSSSRASSSPSSGTDVGSAPRERWLRAVHRPPHFRGFVGQESREENGAISSMTAIHTTNGVGGPQGSYLSIFSTPSAAIETSENLMSRLYGMGGARTGMSVPQRNQQLINLDNNNDDFAFLPPLGLSQNRNGVINSDSNGLHRPFLAGFIPPYPSPFSNPSVNVTINTGFHTIAGLEDYTPPPPASEEPQPLRLASTQFIASGNNSFPSVPGPPLSHLGRTRYSGPNPGTSNRILPRRQIQQGRHLLSPQGRKLAEEASVLLEVVSKSPSDNEENRQLINTTYENVTKLQQEYGGPLVPGAGGSTTPGTPSPGPSSQQASGPRLGPATAAAIAASGQSTSRKDAESGTMIDAACSVCLTEVADTVLLPCNHLVLCSACCDVLGIMERRHSFARPPVPCPICRKLVTDRIKVFRG